MYAPRFDILRDLPTIREKFVTPLSDEQKDEVARLVSVETHRRYGLETEEEEQREMGDCFDKFEMFVECSVDPKNRRCGPHEAADAFLLSLVTQAWSAYECLAADLWVTVLNVHHSKFLPNIKAAKKIDWNKLGDCGHDPNTEMGRCLKNDFYKQLGLNGLGRIGPTYAATFGATWVPLNGKPYYKGLFALERFRNLIVHSAGIVDKPFLDQIQKDGITIFGTPLLGDPILLDGALCEKLISSAVVAGMDLISFVTSQI